MSFARPSENRRRWRDYSLRDLAAVGLPSLVLVIFGFWLAARFIQPAPPSFLTMSSGGEGGAYQLYAARYRDELAKNDIQLRETPSSGAVENLARLRSGEADVAFIQGGIGIGSDMEGLMSLGSLYYEPLWVFYRGRDHGREEVRHLNQFSGRRIAIGAEGSGTRALAVTLLEANGAAGAPTQLLPLSGMAAVQALQKGEVDVVFAVGAPESGAVWSLLYSEGVKLMSFVQAEAYARRYPYLSPLVLPAGAIDFVRNIPATDVNLVAPMATLVVREDSHPALVGLLMQAASHLHGGAGLFQKAGEFPNAVPVTFPLSKEADRFYKSGRPFLQRYLPFWAATLIDRTVVMLIPVLALLLPLARILPALYSWRVRSRLFRWYGELKFLEAEVESDFAAHSPEQWLQKLDRIEAGANALHTPLAFSDQLYTLRSHIAMVREILRRKVSQLPAEAAPARPPSEH